MYGDTLVMRKRAAQLREQGEDIRAMAEQLVTRSDEVAWSGRAADSMRERVRDRAAHLREAANAHDTAAATLEKHLTECDRLGESIAGIERRRVPLARGGRQAASPGPVLPRHAVRPQGLAHRRAPGPLMVTVDLGAPPAPPASTLDGLPRRLPMTLPELRLAAEKAGGAPLPFEMAAPTTTNASGGPPRRDARQRRGSGVRRRARRPPRAGRLPRAPPPARRRPARRGARGRHRPARHPDRRRRLRRRRRGRPGEGVAPPERPRRRHALDRRRHRVRARLAGALPVGRRDVPRRGAPRRPADAGQRRARARWTSRSSCSTPPARRCTAGAATWCPCSPTTTPARSSRATGRCRTPMWPASSRPSAARPAAASVPWSRTSTAASPTVGRRAVLAAALRRVARPADPPGRRRRPARPGPRRRRQRPRTSPGPPDGGGVPVTEEIQVPTTPVEAADLADKYDRMLRLADLFDSSGQEMRARSKLGAEILRDEGVAESSELSKATYDAAADDIRAATTGKHGLLTRSIELDADALVVRATVLTYRWIDELQEAAYKTLGTIAGPRHRVPRSRRRARRRHRVGRPDRDRRAGPRRHRRLPERPGRGQPRPDGPRHQRRRRPGRGDAAALAADLRAARRRPRPDGRRPAGCARSASTRSPASRPRRFATSPDRSWPRSPSPSRRR